MIRALRERIAQREQEDEAAKRSAAEPQPVLPVESLEENGDPIYNLLGLTPPAV